MAGGFGIHHVSPQYSEFLEGKEREGGNVFCVPCDIGGGGGVPISRPPIQMCLEVPGVEPNVGTPLLRHRRPAAVLKVSSPAHQCTQSSAHSSSTLRLCSMLSLVKFLVLVSMPTVFSVLIRWGTSCFSSSGSCNAANMYAEQLNDVLKYSCSKKVAAFFAEPIQVSS